MLTCACSKHITRANSWIRWKANWPLAARKSSVSAQANERRARRSTAAKMPSPNNVETWTSSTSTSPIPARQCSNWRATSPPTGAALNSIGSARRSCPSLWDARGATWPTLKQSARQIETLAEARQKLVEQIAVSLKMSRRKAIDVEATLREREKLLSDGEQNLAALERALAEKQSRLEILCQLNEEGEGLAEGSRAVMKGIGEFSRFREAITG